MERGESEKPPYLQSGFEEGHQSSVWEHLDKTKHEEESKACLEVVSKANQTLSDMMVFNDEKSHTAWHRLTARPEQLLKTCESLRQKITSSPQGKTLYARTLDFIFVAGEEFLLANNLERLRQLAKKNNFYGFFEPYAKPLEFATTENLSVKIDGLSMQALLDNPNVSPSKAYKFFIEAVANYSKLDFSLYEKVLVENREDELLVRYPTMAKERIQQLGGEITALVETGADSSTVNFLLRTFHINPQGSEKEIVSTAEKMIKRISKIREAILNTLFDPSSTDFPYLKETITEYLRGKDDFARVYALHLLLLTYDELARGFRLAQSLSKNGSADAPFYEFLATSIRKHVEETLSSFDSHTLPTREDLVMVIDKDKNPEWKPVPTFEELRLINTSMAQKSSRKNYVIDPNKIEWQNLIPPTQIYFTFSEAGPRKFEITFGYKNEEEESLRLDFGFDTKKGGFNWSFMEDPDNLEMKPIKDAVFIAAKSILLDVQRQAEQEWQDKQQSKTAERIVFNGKPVIPSSKTQSETPYMPREKQEKEERQRPLTPIQEILSSGFLMPSPEKVKRQISLPPEEDMQKMTSGISAENQEMILGKIQDFNEKGTGRFKALPEYRVSEGKKVYELRTGDYRVLLLEKPAENVNANKIHAFEIYKIGDRKEIFKSRQKE